MIAAAGSLRPYHLQDAIAYFAAYPDIVTQLEAALTQYYTDIQAEAKYIDPRCGGIGRYPKSNDTGNPDDKQLIRCTSCNGYGYTAIQNKPIIKWPAARIHDAVFGPQAD